MLDFDWLTVCHARNSAIMWHIIENMSKTHLPCDPIYTDAECTRWADLMKMTEKMTDDGLDYNTTVTKIMDTIPNETIEENFIIIENITLPDT